MNRHDDDRVDVRVDEAPTAFVWRGRLHVVHEVLGRWQEHRARRHGAAAQAVRGGGGVALAEHEIWRVEASAGRTSPRSVYDLCRDIAPSRQDVGDSPWRLLEVCD